MSINKENIAKMQLIKYDLFKAQNPDTGLFDVMFEVEGNILYAHKNMLNLVSSTFASMLSDRWISNKEAPIKIEDYSYNNFYQFITFLYSGQCELNDTNINAMIDISEFYGVALFKEYCDEYLSARTITIKNAFQMMDLAYKYSMVQLKATTHEYIVQNFQSFVNCDEFLKIPKYVLEELVSDFKYTVKPDDLFLAIYKWCEKQAIEKLASDPSLNLHEIIKAEIAVFLPNIQFQRMELTFLHEFVVSRGFIFSTYNELSKTLCDRDRYNATKIKITNDRGQTLHGNLISDKTIIENIKVLNYVGNGCVKHCWWGTDIKNIPTTPSSIKKRDDIEWYLVYNAYGNTGVKRSSLVNDDKEYLLAEMFPGAFGFDTADGCKIEITE